MSGHIGIMLGLLVGTVLAVLVYNDAQDRPNDETLWALMSFFFGIFGAIVYLIVRK